MRLCPNCERALEGMSWRCSACGFEPRLAPYPVLAELPELESGYEPQEVLGAAAAEAASFWALARNRLVVQLLRQSFPRPEAILDLGCGIGIVLEALQTAFPAARLVGGDGYRPVLDEASRRLRGVELVQLDARRLPFVGEFDVITVLDVLEHVDADRRVLAEVYRARRPGGGAVVAVPQYRWLWSRADEWALHHRRYVRRELREKLTGAGFELVRTTSFVATLLPLLAVARAVQRRTSRYDPVAEFRLARPVDAILRRALLAENALVARGLDLPAGGSLVAVVRRPESS